MTWRCLPGSEIEPGSDQEVTVLWGSLMRGTPSRYRAPCSKEPGPLRGGPMGRQKDVSLRQRCVTLRRRLGRGRDVVTR